MIDIIDAAPNATSSVAGYSIIAAFGADMRQRYGTNGRARK